MALRLALFFIITSIVGIAAHAQSVITLNGNVLDEKNQPISDATILDLSNGHGTISDNQGNFSLVISSQPTTIRISHIGFMEKKIEITEADLQQSTNHILSRKIILKSLPVELSPVDVTAGKRIRAYNKPWIPVIDFEFAGPNLILLVYENKKYDVRLVNGNDSMLLRAQLSFTPESFFKDCLDQFHVLSADSNYRIEILPDKIFVVPSSDRKTFDGVVMPCVAATEQAFYFEKLGQHNQSVFYTESKRENDDERLFAVVRDSIGEQLAQEELQRVMGLSSYATAQMSDIYLSADLSKARAFLNDMWFYQKIRTIPIYDPLLKVRDSLYLFNHAMGRLEVYDHDGKFFRSMPIQYEKDKEWNKQIVVDESNDEVYLAFALNGYITLKKFNLSSGNFISETQLDQALFPETIKIKNGIAYFLLQNSEEYMGYNLFMQHLN